jgi:AP-1 complex subunit sigma 1/2
MLMSRQGKVRLAKWYSTYTQKERARVVKETTPLVLSRPLKLCNFVDWKGLKLVYKRYASLYFLCGVDPADNELLVLEIIHHFVECLDMCARVCLSWQWAWRARRVPRSAAAAVVCWLRRALDTARPVAPRGRRYFGNVCELDLIFNFHKAYYILDELLIAGAGWLCCAHRHGVPVPRGARPRAALRRCAALSPPQKKHACPKNAHPGELQEPSKRAIARVIEDQDRLVEAEKEGMADGDAAT